MAVVEGALLERERAGTSRADLWQMERDAEMPTSTAAAKCRSHVWTLVAEVRRLRIALQDSAWERHRA